MFSSGEFLKRKDSCNKILTKMFLIKSLINSNLVSIPKGQE